MLRASGVLSTGAAVSATAALVDGTTLFTISGGPIAIKQLQSICITAAGVAVETIQYSSSPTVGSAKTFSGASASLSGVAAGTTVTLNKTALTTAPDVVTAANGGLPLGANVANDIIVQAGTITSVIASATTGTWQHVIAYYPLAPGVTVV